VKGKRICRDVYAKQNRNQPAPDQGCSPVTLDFLM
jgi:hypothetical protein